MFAFSQASVNDEGQLLKRKKADAQRQQDMLQRVVRMKNIIDILYKEIIILKIK